MDADAIEKIFRGMTWVVAAIGTLLSGKWVTRLLDARSKDADADRAHELELAKLGRRELTRRVLEQETTIKDLRADVRAANAERVRLLDRLVFEYADDQAKRERESEPPKGSTRAP